VVMAVVLVIVLGLAVWRIQSSHKKSPAPKVSGPSAPTAKASGSQTSKPLTAGNDNDSLAKDSANLNGSLGEGTQNLQAATTAVNDESHVVDVPTN
jgi:hypothetical protein